MRAFFVYAAAIVVLVCSCQSFAATYYWDGSISNRWNVTSNWTVNGGTPLATPRASDDVVFYLPGAGNLNTGLRANFSINSLTFNATATNSVTVGNGSSSRTLTIGAGGITIGSGSGAHTISVSTIALGSSQIWLNDSSNQFTVSSAISMGTRTLTTAGSGNMLLSGVMSGTGSLVKTGTGTVTTSANNTYTGPTTVSGGTLVVSGTSASTSVTINGGTLQLGASNRISNSANILVGSGGTFDHQTYSEQIGALTLNGGNVIGSAGTLTVSSLTSTGGNVHSGTAGAMTLNGNLSYNTDSGNETTLIVGGTVNLASTRNFNVADGTQLQDVRIDGVIAGSGGLTKNGEGTLALAGNNTYSGVTTINTGVVQTTADERIYNSGTMTITSDGTFDHQTYSEQIGALTLNGGSVIGSAGTLAISSLTSTGGNVHASGGATLSLGGNATYNANSGSETTTTLGGTIDLNVTRTFNVADGVQADDMIITGTLADGTATGGLTKTGGGTLVLSGVNSYSGQTLVSVGVLNLRNSSALGSTVGGTTISSGAAVELQGGIAIGAESLTMAGTGVASGGAMRSIGGDNSWAGDITLAANSLVRVTGGTLTLAGTIDESGSGNYEIDKYGSGTLILTGNNANWNTSGTFSVRIYEGAVEVSNQGNLGNELSNVWIGDGATLRFAANATLDDSKYYLFQTANSNFEVAAGKTVTISSDNTLLDFAWTAYAGNAMNKTGEGTLAIANNQWSGSYGIDAGTTIYVSGGILRLDNGNALGQGQSVINNGGTLWISSGISIANSLTLNTGGTLVVDGTYNGASITINGGTIRGGGSLTPPISVPAGAVVSPGASPGTLTFAGGLDLSAGGEYYWELAALTESDPGANYDYISVTGGDLILGGSSTVSINFTGPGISPDEGNSFWNSSRIWKIIDQNGANTTDFAFITNSNYARGHFSTIVGSGADIGDIFLVWSHAPEPGTLILLGLGGVIIIMRRVRTIRRKVAA